MKILISDKSSPSCAELLRNSGHEVDEKFGISPEDLKSIISQYDGLIVRSATKVTEDIIVSGKNLKIIGRAGSGVDNIDVKAAQKKNIVVMNTPGANTNAVVELTLSYLFALSRHLYFASHSMKDGKWEKKKLTGTELLGKTLGVLGYGKIGRQVSIKSRCLGMEVICYDPYVGREIIDQFGVKLVAGIDEVLNSADYISIHVPKTPETSNFITRQEFSKMKKGVYIINCARGGIVNDNDLLWALNEGIVAGAGIDVYSVEPPDDLSLVNHPNVICTPHIGAATKEAQENVGTQIAQQFIEMFDGKGIRNAVKPRD
ncbi:MAG: hydroxyacid dehydrogenase [Calditrichota bacterium]